VVPRIRSARQRWSAAARAVLPLLARRTAGARLARQTLPAGVGRDVGVDCAVGAAVLARVGIAFTIALGIEIRILGLATIPTIATRIACDRAIARRRIEVDDRGAAGQPDAGDHRPSHHRTELEPHAE
jgi:hypothetical protein